MIYDKLPNALDGALVLQFFWRFSVLECALKREGFLRVGRNDAAEPDWSHFGASIAGRFAGVAANGFHEAVQEIEASAPKRQVVRDGQLAWEPLSQQTGESREQFVLRLVKTARNNLFHGGKYPDGPIEEIARDRSILRAALAVLEGCYGLHPGIAAWVSQAA